MKKTFRGYICRNCDFSSNKRKNWIITEDDVKCKRCGSSNVEPTDLELGVVLEQVFKC